MATARDLESSDHYLIGIQMCHHHLDMEIDQYCESHHVVGCHKCMQQNHSDCEKIHSIDSYESTQIIPQDQVQQLASDIDNTLTDTQRKAKTLEELIKNRKECVQNISDLINEIKNDEQEQKVTRYLESANKYITKLLAIKDNIGNIGDNVIVPNVLTKHWKDIVAEVNEFNSSREPLDEDLPVPSLDTLKEVERILQHPQYPRSSDEWNDPQYPRSSDEWNDPQYPSYSDEWKEVNMKLDQESDCDIQSICTANNGDIFIADYENKCLKHLTKQDGKIKKITFVGRPCYICMLEKDEVLVCLEEQSFFGKEFKLVSVDSVNLKLNDNSRRFSHNCGGLAVDNKNVYVSDCNKTIHVYKLPDLSSHFTETNFTQCGAMALNKDMNTLFVTYGEKGLYVWDVQKESKTSQKFEFPINKIQTLCSGDGRTIFLVDDRIREVQLSARSEVISMKTIDIGNFEDIQAICYNSHNRSLLIATRKNNIVTEVSSLLPEKTTL